MHTIDLAYVCTFADTAEHKYKKSQLRRVYGSGPYFGAKMVSVGLTPEQAIPVRGPDASRFSRLADSACSS